MSMTMDMDSIWVSALGWEGLGVCVMNTLRVMVFDDNNCYIYW